MQTTRIYDTHRAIKKFISLGFSEEQSEGMVEELVKLSEQAQGSLATKSELQEVKAELKSDIQAVKSDLREVEMRLENKIEKEIGSVRAELQTHFKYLYVMGTGLIIALLAPHLQNLLHLIK